MPRVRFCVTCQRVVGRNFVRHSERCLRRLADAAGALDSPAIDAENSDELAVARDDSADNVGFGFGGDGESIRDDAAVVADAALQGRASDDAGEAQGGDADVGGDGGEALDADAVDGVRCSSSDAEAESNCRNEQPIAIVDDGRDPLRDNVIVADVDQPSAGCSDDDGDQSSDSSGDDADLAPALRQQPPALLTADETDFCNQLPAHFDACSSVNPVPAAVLSCVGLRRVLSHVRNRRLSPDGDAALNLITRLYQHPLVASSPPPSSSAARTALLLNAIRAVPVTTCSAVLDDGTDMVPVAVASLPSSLLREIRRLRDLGVRMHHSYVAPTRNADGSDGSDTAPAGLNVEYAWNTRAWRTMHTIFRDELSSGAKLLVFAAFEDGTLVTRHANGRGDHALLGRLLGVDVKHSRVFPIALADSKVCVGDFVRVGLVNQLRRMHAESGNFSLDGQRYVVVALRVDGDLVGHLDIIGSRMQMHPMVTSLLDAGALLDRNAPAPPRRPDDHVRQQTLLRALLLRAYDRENGAWGAAQLHAAAHGLKLPFDTAADLTKLPEALAKRRLNAVVCPLFELRQWMEPDFFVRLPMDFMHTKSSGSGAAVPCNVLTVLIHFVPNFLNVVNRIMNRLRRHAGFEAVPADPFRIGEHYGNKNVVLLRLKRAGQARAVGEVAFFVIATLFSRVRIVDPEDATLCRLAIDALHAQAAAQRYDMIVWRSRSEANAAAAAADRAFDTVAKLYRAAAERGIPIVAANSPKLRAWLSMAEQRRIAGPPWDVDVQNGERYLRRVRFAESLTNWHDTRSVQALRALEQHDAIMHPIRGEIALRDVCPELFGSYASRERAGRATLSPTRAIVSSFASRGVSLPVLAAVARYINHPRCPLSASRRDAVRAAVAANGFAVSARLHCHGRRVWLSAALSPSQSLLADNSERLTAPAPGSRRVQTAVSFDGVKCVPLLVLGPGRRELRRCSDVGRAHKRLLRAVRVVEELRHFGGDQLRAARDKFDAARSTYNGCLQRRDELQWFPPLLIVCSLRLATREERENAVVARYDNAWVEERDRRGVRELRVALVSGVDTAPMRMLRLDRLLYEVPAYRRQQSN